MADRVKLKLEISGAVQGVGFRPFVYRLARELQLAGWVLNDGRGVFIEVEGDRDQLEAFRTRVESDRPPRAVVMKVGEEWGVAEGFSDFSIRESDDSIRPTVVVLPDVATCDDCLAEIFNPSDRRYGYPFTNCTNCGPRFSIIKSLPYDRPNTTMVGFRMCQACLAEYEEPLDRRFHAQPNACAFCGPAVTLVDGEGVELATDGEALAATVAELRTGRIVALKGLGGFLLLVDAVSEDAVSELRRRKGRYEKPLALMVPDLDCARSLCRVDAKARELLKSPEAPIVLLERGCSAPGSVALGVAPGNPRLGLMLPYTPLHHLLLRAFDGPLVATSGNLSDEPICIDNDEAQERLGRTADLFLMHDRPIARHVDDSVIQFVSGAPQPLRRARGYAPLPVQVGQSLPVILAVGGHLKNAAALSVEDKVFVSQHIGDMETPEARLAFERVIVDFLELYETRPECVAHDLHPDYPSSRWAHACVAGERPSELGLLEELTGLPSMGVQHHHAHLASCLAEHRVDATALGVTWDGTGFGTDGTVWGGEFLVGSALAFDRVAALRPFRLPGGDAAVKEPRRAALALLWELQAAERIDLPPIADMSAAERRALQRMLERAFRSPVTTSAGRLFDGVASLLGLKQRVSYEGQAAMMLEHVADRDERGAYPLPLVAWRGIGDAAIDAPSWMLDWGPLIEALIDDSRSGTTAGMIAARFHNALAEGIVDVASRVGEERVVLTGGCFQNRLLSERAAERLQNAGFNVLQHRLVPANDGGLSLGQVMVAAARLESDEDGAAGIGVRADAAGAGR